MLLVVAVSASAAPGLVTTTSSHDVATTTDRLAERVTEAGFSVFARIDHAAGATGVDMLLRPTELLLFGNPMGGTLLMQSAQTAGIDLPLKYLVWQDAAGVVHIGWNAPAWVAGRHAIEDRGALIERMADALRELAAAAAADG
jgi:uncharacterized protein (DUF302 family)